MQKVQLTRASLSSHKAGIDITAKNARGWLAKFAPKWSMVLGHKAGTLTNEKYTQQYHELLKDICEEEIQYLYEFGAETYGHTIRFKCFCADGAFCHTYLLIDWLVQHYPDLFEVSPDLK